MLVVAKECTDTKRTANIIFYIRVVAWNAHSLLITLGLINDFQPMIDNVPACSRPKFLTGSFLAILKLASFCDPFTNVRLHEIFALNRIFNYFTS